MDRSSSDFPPNFSRTISVDSIKQQLLNDQQVMIADTPFLVRRPRIERGSTAGRYVKCELGDRSGWLEAVWWDALKMPKVDLDSLLTNEVWSVTGLASINHYGGKKIPQVKIERARSIPCEDPTTIPGLVRRSASSEVELSDWLSGCLALVKNAPLRRLLEETIGESGPWHKTFLRVPAALYYHHAYVGGLVDHVREMASVWLSSQQVYPSADSALTLSGILLHDVGKLDIYGFGVAPQLAPTGRYMDHISTGIARLSLAIDSIPGFPHLLKDQLLHIVASHHGDKEFGSPVTPATREAIVVHHLDRMSSLLSHLEEWTLQSGVDQFGWTIDASPWLKTNLAGSHQIPNQLEEI